MKYIIITIIIIAVIALFIAIYSALIMASKEDDKCEINIGNINTCVCCGQIIPEGRQVCPNCEGDAESKRRINYVRTDD